MAVERELKFDLAEVDAARLSMHPAIGMFAGSSASSRLSTRYFEIGAGHLAAAGFALRLRRTPAGCLLTLKSAGADALGHARGEWEWGVSGDAALELKDLERLLRETPLGVLGLDAATLQRELRPVYATEFVRQSWLVELEGSRIDVALDRGHCVASRAGREVRAPLHELELELLDGDWHACWELAWALAQDMPLRLSPVNKAQRASALLRGERVAPVHEPPAVDADGTLGEAAQRWLSTATAQLAVWGERIRAADQVRDVHQFRVVLRRLRTTLRWLGPHASPAAVEWFRGELRWAMALAGPVRDSDVWMTRLRAIRSVDVGMEPVLDLLGHQRQRHRALLCSYLESARFARLLLAMARWAEVWGTAVGAGHGELKRLGRRAVEVEHCAWVRAWEASEAALTGGAVGAFDDPGPEASARLHALRISSKRLRLALERLGGLLPPRKHARYARLHDATEMMQARLGDWHDLQRLREQLGRDVERLPPDIDVILQKQARASLQDARAALRRDD